MRESNVVSKLGKLEMNKCFGEHISWHFVRATVLESDDTLTECLTNVMVTDCDVLGSGMKGRFFRKLDSRLVVAVDKKGVVEDMRGVKLG